MTFLINPEYITNQNQTILLIFDSLFKRSETGLYRLVKD
ncbi:hypothetical protein FLJC2902T_25250 [Flavobacterium limnosediminis JC2902]|uniref:Uncharacterized protein n=1 Tax=Flavobacterium limnosediminis JC2902 TaxID=1341181 RepID=V6SJB4_9FLAO|nr:hypothetical protein FLJC2902T_25250 [Flavobacterium limnosediminis JC2902]